MASNVMFNFDETATSIELHGDCNDTVIVTGTTVDGEYSIVEEIPIDRDLFEVAHRVLRKRKFLACGIIEIYDVWWNDDTERYRWRLVYARMPVGDRRSGMCHRKVNIVRRSKHRGRHWDRKSA